VLQPLFPCHSYCSCWHIVISTLTLHLCLKFTASLNRRTTTSGPFYVGWVLTSLVPTAIMTCMACGNFAQTKLHRVYFSRRIGTWNVKQSSWQVRLLPGPFVSEHKVHTRIVWHVCAIFCSAQSVYTHNVLMQKANQSSSCKSNLSLTAWHFWSLGCHHQWIHCWRWWSSHCIAFCRQQVVRCFDTASGGQERRMHPTIYVRHWSRDIAFGPFRRLFNICFSFEYEYVTTRARNGYSK